MPFQSNLTINFNRIILIFKVPILLISYYYLKDCQMQKKLGQIKAKITFSSIDTQAFFISNLLKEVDSAVKLQKTQAKTDLINSKFEVC